MGETCELSNGVSSFLLLICVISVVAAGL